MIVNCSENQQSCMNSMVSILSLRQMGKNKNVSQVLVTGGDTQKNKNVCPVSFTYGCCH